MIVPLQQDLPDRAAVDPQGLGDERRVALVTDLKSLRRGRAIFTSQIRDRVGATLCGLAGVVDDDGPAEIRTKVARHLRNLAEALPDDLRLASLTAFAIEPGSRHPLYKDRVALTAERIRRDPRTARRRIDEAIEQLAQIATAKPGFGRELTTTPTGGWWISELRMSLALDRSRPELVEQCQLVAEQHDVREIEAMSGRLGMFADLTADQVASDVFYGGTVRSSDTRPGGHLATLGLPRPLMSGEVHEYAMRSTVSSADVLPKECRFRTDRRCDRFDLRVRFDLTNLPRRVWPIDDETRQLRPDDAGDVQVEFAFLTPDRDYGIRWE
jgi:hypothetical protein